MTWIVKHWDKAAPMADDEGGDALVEVDGDDLIVQRIIDDHGALITRIPRSIVAELFTQHDAYQARVKKGNDR